MALKKQKQLELKIEEIEKTLSHQREVMAMMKDTMMNQKMVLEMIVTKLNEQPSPAAPTTSPAQATPPPPPAAETQKASNVFPLSRRVMV